MFLYSTLKELNTEQIYYNLIQQILMTACLVNFTVAFARIRKFGHCTTENLFTVGFINRYLLTLSSPE